MVVGKFYTSMKRTPKISVIVPVYNTADYIGSCLESILKQTLDDIEVIVINDGSTDDSLDIIEDFAGRDERILFRSKEHSGLSDSRNLGIELACGDYLAFIDSDDWIDGDALEKLYKHAQDKSADLVLFRYRFYEDTGRTRETKPLEKFLNYGGENITLNTCPGLMSISTSSCVKLFSRKMVKKYNITYPPGLNYEDWPFCYMAYYHAENIALLDESLYNYRTRSNSIISLCDSVMFDYFKIFSIIEDFFNKHPVSAPVIHRYAQKKISTLLILYSRIDSPYKRAFFDKVRDTMNTDTGEMVGDIFIRMQMRPLKRGNYSLFRLLNWLRYGLI